MAIGAVVPLGDASADRAQVLGGVQSLHAMRWDNLVRQRLEVGCGAASLATLMTYYFGFPTTEEELANAMAAEAEADGQAELVRHIGFSMSHIRRVAEKGGLVARAFRVPIESIDKIRIPVIARVSIRGFDHFVVLKGAQNGRVFVADPAFGNSSYRLAAFEKIWQGALIGFVRRGALPQDHGLMVGMEDDPGAAWERATDRTIGSLRDVGRPASVGLSGQVIPLTVLQLVPGLESAFPRFLSTTTVF